MGEKRLLAVSAHPDDVEFTAGAAWRAGFPRAGG